MWKEDLWQDFRPVDLVICATVAPMMNRWWLNMTVQTCHIFSFQSVILRHKIMYPIWEMALCVGGSL